MKRDEFINELRIVDDVFDDDPFTLHAQKIADHDADRRMLLACQRALIDEKATQIEMADHAYKLLAEAHEQQAKEIEQLKNDVRIAKDCYESEVLKVQMQLLPRIEDQAKEIARLKEQGKKFSATFLDRMNKYGQWEDGCFYYNGTCASELQEVIDMAKQALKEYP